MSSHFTDRGCRLAVASAFLASLLTVLCSQMHAQNFWTGGGTLSSMGWSDAANWSFGSPPNASDVVSFDDINYSGYVFGPGIVNNVVDQNFTVGGASFTALATPDSHYYTTLIPAGFGLTLAGAAGTTSLRVGYDVAGGNNSSVLATMTGAGSLSVNGSGSTINISVGANGSGTHKGTLDLSGLNSITVNVSNLLVGVGSAIDRTSGILLLPTNSTITTAANLGAPGILLGRGMTNSGFGSVTMGATTVINTDGLVVGGARSSFGANMLNFQPLQYGTIPTATLTLRGSAGGSSRVDVLAIGDGSATETNYLANANGTGTGSSSSPSTADFTSGTVDALINNLMVGRSAADNPGAPSGSSAGTSYGRLLLNNGTINALNAAVALKQGTNRSSTVGTLTLGGAGTLVVVNDLTLASVTNTVTGVTATININDNASLSVGGNMMTKGGTSTINLGGGSINMTGSGVVSANNLAGIGSITGSSAVVLSNSLTLGTATSTTVLPGTISLAGNLTLASAVAPKFKLGSSTTTGNGINDYLNVGGNLTLNNNGLDLVFAGVPAIGSYNLIDYGGTKSGNFNLTFANTTRNYTFALDQSVANHIRLNVGGGPGANLTWKGGSGGVWDLTNTVSWNNDTEKFYNLDNVLFDDNGAFGIITVPSGRTVAPASITFNNNSLLYTFYASGKISGPTSLTKSGSGTVILAGTGSHDYTGPVNVNEGTLQVQSTSGSSILGVTNKMITVASGATFDVYGNTVGSSSGSGYPITLSGAGVNGVGALAHTKPSSGPTFYTPRVTLAGDASIGVTFAGLNLILNSPSGPLSGNLDLAGNTLTATGQGNLNLVNMVATGAGNILVQTPNLVLRDVILDGSGALVLDNNNLVLGSLSGTAWTTGYVAKAISFGQGSILAPANNSLIIPINSPIDLAGDLTVDHNQWIRLAGAISGTGGLIKTGNGRLYLSGANTYNGPTIVSGTALILEAGGSIANSPLIRVDGGKFFDVQEKAGSYVLPAGQTVRADGTVLGNLTVPVGATLSGSNGVAGQVTVNGGSVIPGEVDLPRTLSVSNLVLNSAKLTFELDAQTTQGGNVNDLITASQLNFLGTSTIKIVPIGSLDTSGNPYTLFVYSGAPLPSSFTNNLVLTSDSRYSFAFVDPATTPGIIQITVTGGREGLTWKGGSAAAPTAWNLATTPNWDNNGSPSAFFNGDSVVFDDTALTNRVTLAGDLRPATISLANNSLAFRFEGAGSLRTGAITNNGVAGLTIANSTSNSLNGAGLFMNAGPITFDQPVDTAFSSVINGVGTINKQGSNKLTMYGDNTITYSGPLNINAGTIKAGNSNALGSGSITVAGGATLDINGQPLDYPFITVSGTGVGGRGAIVNSGSAQTNAMTKLTLQGDTTLSSSNRWDFIPGISTFLGQDHALTKVGPGEIRLNIGLDTGLGDIDIKEGRLIFGYAGTDLGNTANTITVRSNASLSFTGGIAAGAKPTTVLPGGFIEAAAGVNVSSNSYAGDITFLDQGVFRLGTLAQLEVSGSISSPSGVVNADVGTLVLSGSNHYSGDLTVRRGPVTIASSNALPSGTTVTMDGDTENQGVFLSLANDVSTPANVPLNMKSYRTPSGPRTPRLDGQGTWTGPINLIGIQLDPSQNPQITIGGSSNLTISGPVTQSGSPLLNLNIEGFPGTVKFESPLQYNGTMRMGSQGLGIDPDLTGKITTLELASSNNAFTNMLFWRGKIKISANDAIPINCPITTSFIRTDNDARGIIDLNGHFQTFSNFPGITGTLVAMPVWFGNDSTTSDATIIFQSAITNSWNCWILDNLDTNIVSARKTGLSVTSGFLRLAPWSWSAWFDPSSIVANTTSNTYTGPTLVTGGGLQVDTWLGNTPVTVSGSGILAGKGPFNAPVVIAAGGTLSPGGNANATTAVGWMTNNSTLTLQAGSQCYFEVNLTAKTNDAVIGLDTVTYGGTLLITNVGAQAITNGSAFKLFSATNYVAGPLTIQPATPGFGLVWDTSTMAADGTLRVVSAPSAPVIGSYGTTGDGNFAVTVNGASGQQYSLFGSTNVAAPLNAWTLIQSATQVGSTITLFDLGATNYPTRFYRISTP